jgi:enoyl-CoA hydratase
MDYKNIIFNVEDGIALITFNRPKALNAISVEIQYKFWI